MEPRTRDKGRAGSPPEVREREFASDQSGEVFDHPLRRVDKVRLEDGICDLPERLLKILHYPIESGRNDVREFVREDETLTLRGLREEVSGDPKIRRPSLIVDFDIGVSGYIRGLTRDRDLPILKLEEDEGLGEVGLDEGVPIGLRFTLRHLPSFG